MTHFLDIGALCLGVLALAYGRGRLSQRAGAGDDGSIAWGHATPATIFNVAGFLNVLAVMVGAQPWKA